MRRKRIGLALGGGGARGFAHLGVIRELAKHGIPIDLIAGTSMGGVVGGAYACGIDLARLEILLKSLDLNKLLNIPKKSLIGLVGNTASEYLLKELNWRTEDSESTRNAIEFFDLFTKHKKFEDLKIDFGVVAVDVDSGVEMHLRTGSIARAICAGIAVPGIQYPVNIDGQFLVDGGLVTKVPVSLAFEMGADVVIAVDVSLPALAGGGLTSIEVLMQSEGIMMRELTKIKLDQMRAKHKDKLLVIEPDVDDVKTFELDDIDTPADRGAQAIERRIDEIRALVV